MKRLFTVEEIQPGELLKCLTSVPRDLVNLLPNACIPVVIALAWFSIPNHTWVSIPQPISRNNENGVNSPHNNLLCIYPSNREAEPAVLYPLHLHSLTGVV